MKFFRDCLVALPISLVLYVLIILGIWGILNVLH
jgi:hypothetical protein